MRIAVCFLVLITFCLPASRAASPAQMSNDENIVATAFPPDLATPGGLRLYIYERADLDGVGSKDYVVAVYSNGFQGAVRVLRLAGGVIDETHYRLMSGHVPLLRLIDVDGDGKPEIIAGFATMGAEATWPFRWSEGRLSLIGPSVVAFGDVRPLLMHVSLLDIDGDGKLEMVHWVPGEPVHQVLKLTGDGTYRTTARKVLYANRFVRHGDDPETYTAQFRNEAGSPLTITIVNGDIYGKHRASDGSLYLNGKQILFHDDINEHTGTFTIPAVSTSTANEIEMELTGPDGTEVSVSVSPKQK